MSKDFYAILGVPRTANEAEIKQAYRKLSRELHPDKHKGDKEKEAKFKEVNEAYEVLSDPKKKSAYDRFGTADFANMGGGGGFGGFQGFEGFDPSQFQNMGGFGDIFDSFFGGGRKSESQGRGRTLELEVEIPFEKSVTGSEEALSFTTLVSCSECSGSGAEKGSKTKSCNECGGTGAVTRQVRSLFGTIRQSMVCETCRGSGKIPEHACKKCSGAGRRSEKKTVNVRIPAGIDDGQSLRVTGEGEAGAHGKPAGDLLIRIHVRPDARFEREGDDIKTMLMIEIADAVLGAEKTVETVHGPTTISIPAGTQPGQVLRMKAKGMPIVNTSRHGDHYVTIEVHIPGKLSKEQRKIFEELRKTA